MAKTWPSVMLAGCLLVAGAWAATPRDDHEPAAAVEEQAKPAAAPKQEPQTPKWVFGSSLRSRVELWDWFDPGNPPVGKENTYAFWATYLRVTASRSWKHVDFFSEGSVPLLIALPKDATAPPPQGQLGLGAAYKAANGDRVIYPFVRQAYVTFKGIGNYDTRLRVGRFEFVEGAESFTKDPTLDWIKRERIAHRLIGNFVFTHVQRAADGANFFYDARGTNVTVVAARPTVGVFELNGNKNIPNVEYAYAAVTHTGKKKDYDARLFYIFYDDGRRLVPVDNRPLAVRRLDFDPIRISTFGGHYVRKIGRFDLLGWGALQGGDWGSQSQRAWAWSAELGFQPAAGPVKPWLRAGMTRTSGDGNPSDSKHGTFFQILPTPRIYARFPFFNMMNMQDDFVQMMIRPGSRFTIRSDYRWLRLSEAADLWYSGGGAFQKGTFGFTGRPSGGSRDLGQLADASIEFRATPKTTLTFYYGHAFGGKIIQSIYPAGSGGNLALWELSQRF